jgi:hypothetical protein
MAVEPVEQVQIMASPQLYKEVKCFNTSGLGREAMKVR